MSDSVKNFYGQARPVSARMKRLEAAAAKVSSPFMSAPGCLIPLDVYHVQDDAIAAAQSKNVTAFAVERDAFGKRDFVAADAVDMWKSLQGRKRGERHIYEIIPLGHPAKLYFDVEFDKTVNTDRLDLAEQAVTRLIDTVKSELAERFQVACPMACVFDLDSTTEDKFSRHFIFNLPDACFENNFEAGSFARIVNDKLGDECTFRTKEGALRTFIDLGVYSKNRNLRVFKSSKFGKKAVFKRSEVSLPRHSELSDREYFLNSLVTWFGIKIPPRLPLIGGGSALARASRIPSAQGSAASSSSAKSPFPEIDEFVKSLIFPQGSIRKCVWNAAESAIEYEISGFRFCANVKREHKSNNIKYIVLPKRGVYFQLCHDPDCAGFKSEDFSLPKEAQPWLDLLEEDSCGNEEDRFLLDACKEF